MKTTKEIIINYSIYDYKDEDFIYPNQKWYSEEELLEIINLVAKKFHSTHLLNDDTYELGMIKKQLFGGE